MEWTDPTGAAHTFASSNTCALQPPPPPPLPPRGSGSCGPPRSCGAGRSAPEQAQVAVLPAPTRPPAPLRGGLPARPSQHLGRPQDAAAVDAQLRRVFPDQILMGGDTQFRMFKAKHVLGPFEAERLSKIRRKALNYVSAKRARDKRARDARVASLEQTQARVQQLEQGLEVTSRTAAAAGAPATPVRSPTGSPGLDVGHCISQISLLVSGEVAAERQALTVAEAACASLESQDRQMGVVIAQLDAQAKPGAPLSAEDRYQAAAHAATLAAATSTAASCTDDTAIKTVYTKLGRLLTARNKKRAEAVSRRIIVGEERSSLHMKLTKARAAVGKCERTIKLKNSTKYIMSRMRNVEKKLGK